jgi:peptide/nickel transport system substrate-binding protein
MRSSLYALSAAALSVTVLAAPGHAEPRYAIAMQGEPALPRDFSHFPYSNPDAPKGGEITYCVVGGFDNLNPFIIKSLRTTARGVIDTIYGNLVFEPLMQRNAGEAFSLYGLLAESVDLPEDRKEATFNLNPNAKWSDGQPVTPEDVIFTYDVFRDKGRPPYSDRAKTIKSLEKVGPHSVRFVFDEKADREFPLIIALTPILPRHAFSKETFDQTTLKPVTGSGPYIIEKVEPGEKIVFRRNPDYWAKEIPSKRGFDNYDRITIQYFLNTNAHFEAFKKGLCSAYDIADPVQMERGFDFPAFKDGRVVIGEFQLGLPPVVSGFLFNTRRPVFQDVRVRRALSLLYDFEWANKNIYSGKLERTASFWQNSELSALGVPATDKEKALLAPFPDAVTPEVMNGTWKPASTDGSGRDRKNLKDAFELLKDAGYKLQDGVMVDASGAPLAFEIACASESEVRLASVYQRTLDKLGIKASIRLLDDTQMQQRKQAYEYDMVIGRIGFSGSLSPGSEQIGRWGSASARIPGTFNLAGVESPAVDAAISAMLNAREKEDYVAAVRALDRLLISGAYIVPMQHSTKQYLAYWNYLDHPEATSLYGYQLPVWWRKPQ